MSNGTNSLMAITAHYYTVLANLIHFQATDKSVMISAKIIKIVVKRKLDRSSVFPLRINLQQIKTIEILSIVIRK